MDQHRMRGLIQRIAGITAAREPVEAMFAALAAFEEEARRYNRRHLADPPPGPEEWREIHAALEPHARALADVLATYQDPFSLTLTAGLDAAAGLIGEAAAYGVDAPSILAQFKVRDAVGTVERVAGKLGVFLHSWGRASLKQYRGEGMQRAVEHAITVAREAGYFTRYIARLLDGGAADNGSRKR